MELNIVPGVQRRRTCDSPTSLLRVEKKTDSFQQESGQEFWDGVIAFITDSMVGGGLESMKKSSGQVHPRGIVFYPFKHFMAGT